MNGPWTNASERRRSPMMKQVWEDLLFLHWRVPAASVRALVPAKLEVEEFGGSAWMGITPLTIRGMRPPYLPSVPLLSRTLEVNVRTYVRCDGVPGVWFFSLEASNRAAVLGARLAFGLPYRSAKISKRSEKGAIRMDARRVHEPEPAEISVLWSRKERLPEARQGYLDHFLIERYCLYTTHLGRLWRIRILHRPWPLGSASATLFNESLLSSHGLHGEGEPLVHAQADPLEVEAYVPERI